jgi:hypothetical protein
MQLATFIDNLERTITGKQFLLGDMELAVLAGDSIAAVVRDFLKIDLEQLMNILADAKTLEAK